MTLGLAAQVGVSESTATLVPGRLRGAMARSECLRCTVGRGRGGRLPHRRARQDEGGSPRARGRCSRRPGTPRAGAGAAPPGSSRTAGPAAAQVRRGRARREPPHLAPRDLEPRVLGHRDVLRPVDGGAAVLTRTSSPGGTRIAGATPPRPWSPTAAWGTTAATSCTGRSSARSPRPTRPGGVREAGEVPIPCGYEAHWGAFNQIRTPSRSPPVRGTRLVTSRA